jgi:hypothetical protein
MHEYDLDSLQPPITAVREMVKEKPARAVTRICRGKFVIVGKMDRRTDAEKGTKVNASLRRQE